MPGRTARIRLTWRLRASPQLGRGTLEFGFGLEARLDFIGRVVFWRVAASTSALAANKGCWVGGRRGACAANWLALD
eukprot:7348475-Pyramimonas_sp.AAC.1